jgi:hypothetical protein
MNSRRGFFREVTNGLLDGAREALRAKQEVERELSGVLQAVTETHDELARFNADFFSSYELSYSLTLAEPREFFEQMAAAAGIAHADVDTLDLVKTLHGRGII